MNKWPISSFTNDLQMQTPDWPNRMISLNIKESMCCFPQELARKNRPQAGVTAESYPRWFSFHLKWNKLFDGLIFVVEYSNLHGIFINLMTSYSIKISPWHFFVKAVEAKILKNGIYIIYQLYHISRFLILAWYIALYVF